MTVRRQNKHTAIRHKPLNTFLLTLGPCYKADPNTGQERLVYDGCESQEQKAFSHEQAITGFLRKYGILNLADDYIRALENRKPGARVVLNYRGEQIDMSGCPGLREMRALVAEKYKMKKSDVRKMEFGDLVLLYERATRVPALSEILKKKSGAAVPGGTVTDDTFSELTDENAAPDWLMNEMDEIFPKLSKKNKMIMYYWLS